MEWINLFKLPWEYKTPLSIITSIIFWFSGICLLLSFVLDDIFGIISAIGISIFTLIHIIRLIHFAITDKEWRK